MTANSGNLTKTTFNFVDSYWITQLQSSPNAINAAGQPYASDPTALPAILDAGYFASSTAANFSTLNSTLIGNMAGAGINALWNTDKAFIVKRSDDTLGLGDGQACAQFPDMTYCDNGVAYFFIRWVFRETMTVRGTPTQILDIDNWQVWGAYPSAAGNPSENENWLGQYNLSLKTIALSSLRVQQAYGFWSKPDCSSNRRRRSS